jgi:hypothetical protein
LLLGLWLLVFESATEGSEEGEKVIGLERVKTAASNLMVIVFSGNLNGGGKCGADGGGGHHCGRRSE